MKLAFSIIQVLASLFLICVVLLQSGKSAGLSGAISGAAESFMSKNKARSWDSRLAKSTTAVAIAFILLTLALNLM